MGAADSIDQSERGDDGFTGDDGSIALAGVFYMILIYCFLSLNKANWVSASILVMGVGDGGYDTGMGLDGDGTSEVRGPALGTEDAFLGF